MFTLLTVTGNEVHVEEHDHLKTAVLAYRKHVIYVQRQLEMKKITHPRELSSVSGKMEASIGAFLYAPNWKPIFARYELDEKKGWW